MRAEDLYQAIGETELKYLEDSACAVSTYTRRAVPRGILIAAIITVLCAITAFAISISLRDAARIDMGISEESPIPEWTEYGDAEKADLEPKDTQVTLMSTMCAGEQLYAYIAVSPVPEEIAAILAENAPEYEWALLGSSTVGCSYNTEQTSYDPETQTALVKVYVHGEELKQIEQVELTLELTHNLKPKKAYGPIVIPITSSQIISTSANIPVENTNAHFEAAWGLRPDIPELPSYVSEGRITRIAICAGYIEIELESPSLEQWLAESGADPLDFEVSPDMLMLPGMEGWYLKRMFSSNWYVSVNKALQGTTINYRDGTSAAIEELPRDFAAIWSPSNNPTHPEYEGKHIYQFMPKQALDLSAIESITIGDMEYPFITAEEIESREHR